MRLHHGAHTAFTAHKGLCLTPSCSAAMTYAQSGLLVLADIDLDGLTVLEVDDYDRNTDDAPGDDGDAHGADVLVYADETETGLAHRTYRLMSAAAIARLQVAMVLPVPLVAWVAEHACDDMDEMIADEWELEEIVEACGMSALMAAWPLRYDLDA